MKVQRLSRGFTIFEMLLVISITTAITAAGIIGLSQLQAIFRIRAAADEIRSLLQYGRELAIANRNQASYSVSFSSGVAVLTENQRELNRFISPTGIIYEPTTFSWSFTPLTGKIIGCSQPCQLTLTSTDNTEIILIQENGIVN